MHLKLTPDDMKPVIIEDDVWLGERAVILKGVNIGRGSIVAAGSMVTKSIPPMSIVAGNPARIVKEIPEARDYERRIE
jgi:acetyltransferase-like isoleucine patch superfamily enzyme